MGRILMKNLFIKKNFFVNELSTNGRKERKFYLILSTALFLIGAFTFWEFIFEFSNMVGAIVSGSPDMAIAELRRMFPLQFSAIVDIYLAMFVNSAYRAGSEKQRIKIWRVNGYVTIILGAIIALYTVIGVITGEYGRLVEGYISPLFPLDFIIGGVLTVVFGVYAIKYAGKLEAKHSYMYFSNGTRPSGRRRATVNVWMVYCYICALCGFAASVYGVFVLDSSHGNIFYNIMLWLNYFMAFAMFAVYKYVYVEMKDEVRPSASRKLGVIFLIVNVLLFVLYMVAVQVENEAPNLNALGLLPVDFTASFNAFAPLYGLNNILAPLAAILHFEKKTK